MTACNGRRLGDGALLGLCLTCHRLGLPGPVIKPEAGAHPAAWVCVQWRVIRGSTSSD